MAGPRQHEDLGIGKRLPGDRGRDAIHVAVLAVMAGTELLPGEGVTQHGLPGLKGKDAIGIVDPYLDSPIQRGEWFWLFLYPNTVTSLRHHWTHPAIGEDQSHLVDDPLNKVMEIWSTSVVPLPPAAPPAGDVVTELRNDWGQEWGDMPPKPDAQTLPVYMTVTAVAMCRAMIDGADYAGTAVLADALEEAGLSDQDTLRTLRAVDNPNYKQETTVRLLLGGEAAEPVRTIKKIAKEMDMSYGALVAAAVDYVENGEEFCLDTVSGPDTFQNHYEEFWDAFEALTGKSVVDENKDQNFFRCAC